MEHPMGEPKQLGAVVALMRRSYGILSLIDYYVPAGS